MRAIGSSTTPASDIVEAQWVAERRGLERFRTEQPPYSILNRGIEREVLPVAQRYGMGTLVWGPLAQGLLTGRVRKGGQNELRRAGLFRHLNDERRLDAVEQFIALAEEAGLPMTHLAMAFAIAHPGVTSAIVGPRTMETPRRPARRHRRRAHRRHPRPDRRDRPARHRCRHARPGVRAPRPRTAEPPPPAVGRTRGVTHPRSGLSLVPASEFASYRGLVGVSRREAALRHRVAGLNTPPSTRACQECAVVEHAVIRSAGAGEAPA